MGEGLSGKLGLRQVEALQSGSRHDDRDKEALGTLRTALYLAKEQGRFRGDPELAIPSSFDPSNPVAERSPTRPKILKVIPHLAPDSAAIVAFILATGAEFSALERARTSDLPAKIRAPMSVPIRGSKNEHRDPTVQIVTDEQVMLLQFARRHAQERGGALFPSLPNLRRALAAACIAAGIQHIWPHSLRHAAGQWLIDLGVPIELVSRFLGHTNTLTTECVYARVRPDAVGARMLDALDPALRAWGGQGAQASWRAQGRDAQGDPGASGAGALPDRKD